MKLFPKIRIIKYIDENEIFLYHLDEKSKLVEKIKTEINRKEYTWITKEFRKGNRVAKFQPQKERDIKLNQIENKIDTKKKSQQENEGIWPKFNDVLNQELDFESEEYFYNLF